MKKIVWVLALSLLYSCSSEKKEDTEEATQNESQVEEEPKESAEESDEKEEEITNQLEEEEPEELSETILCMESEKVAGLIKEPPGPESEDFDEMAEFKMISESEWNGLTQDEKFVYCFAYPEWFDQVCAESAPYRDDYLFSSLPWDNSGASMSTRQSDFIRENRVFVVDRIFECVEMNYKISDTFLRELRNLGAYEKIPFLIELYDHTNNNYILSFFLELMADDEFEAYQTWYENSEFFENYETEYTGVLLTDQMEMEIKQMANDYYAQKMRP